ncbi:hypothetical protein [Amycolatopsis lexingtonensis]|uniref:hypothetical protein n=1 Tax=Amycolatopsis lexingtonensis TaxID=218822 RepID=UPI003F6F271A
MRYVRVTRAEGAETANFLDPQPYLRELPGLVLPVGARAFAADPEHYDFYSAKCVKDLRMGQLAVREAGYAKLAVELTLLPNEFKHFSGLVIRYDDVTNIDLDASRSGPSGRVWPASPRLGDLQLDEVLPSAGGCSHEIKFTGGTIVIECADLTAEWLSE